MPGPVPILQGEYRLLRTLMRRGELSWLSACDMQDERREMLVVQAPRRSSIDVEAMLAPFMSVPRPLWRLRDYFPQDGHQYFLFQGRAAAAFTASRLAEASAVQLARRLCRQLQTLHDLRPQLAAGDLSPAGLMVDAQGEVHVCGYGLPRMLLSRLSWEPYRGALGYAAPEQCGVRPQVNARTDVFGVGTLLWRLLTGLHPALWNGRFPPLRRHAPTVSPALEAVLLEALDPDPVHRIPDAQALLARLDEVVLHGVEHGLGAVLHPQLA